MPVIPYQPQEIDEPAEIVTAIRNRRGGTLLNLDRMLLHSPPFARGWNSFLGAVRNELTVPARLRELVICTVAVLNGAEYEYIQHAPEFLRAGGTQQQLTALLTLKSRPQEDPELPDADLPFIRLCCEMTRTVSVAPATMQAARKGLENDRQLNELVGVIATYNMVSRYLVALGVGVEPEQDAPEETP